MIFEVCERVKEKLKEENIRLEYSSLLNQTSQFVFRQESEDIAIIIPRKINMSEIEAIWTLAHEYGHYLVRNDKVVNEYYMSRLDVERLCWEKGKLFLKELDFPITEARNTYDGFAESCLDTYKADIENYKHKNARNEKARLFINMFAVLSNGFATITNGIIIAYILLTTINMEGKIGAFLGLAISVNIVALVLRYALKGMNKSDDF